MMLEARDLGWAAGRLPIVSGISLAVAEGETLALVGPNGSGKSTLLKLLAGIRKPTAGKIVVDGRALTAMSTRETAQIIAYLEQQAETTEAITVRNAVELGRTPWLTPLQPWSQNDERIVVQAIAGTDMTGFEGRSWATLSGGEKQRTHLARALAQQPQLLLLDEPTNHLDIQHQLAILGLIKRLPVTSIIALHDLNQALTCDRVGVLAAGKLIALGPPHDVLTVARVSEVFGVEASIITDPSDGSQVFRFHSSR